MSDLMSDRNLVLIKDDQSCSDSKDSEASPHDLTVRKSNDIDMNKCFRCSMCPFLCLTQPQIVQHIATKHKEKFVSPQVHLKCPGCKNTFCSRCSLQLHLLNYHQVDPNDISGLLSLAIRIEINYNEKYDIISYVNLNTVPVGVIENANDSISFNESFYELNQSEVEQKNPLEVKFSEPPALVSNVLNLSHINQKSVKNEILILPKSEQAIIETGLKEKLGKTKKSNKLKVEKDEKLDQQPKLFKCWYSPCNVRLKCESNMQYHQRCHLNEGSGLHCPECKMKISVWNSLRGHLWREHKIDMELYACDQCTYRTFSMSKLNTIHKLIHGENRSFLCDICAKAFKNPKQLRNHKMIHKNRYAETVVHCEICLRKFANKRLLKLHMEAVHEKLKKHLCKFCGYKANSKSAVQLHERTHTGYRPYSCTLCEYSTADRNSLRRHNLRHTGQYSYKCPYCSYACIQSSTFKNHLKSKHPSSEGKNMFSCKLCSFKSVREDNYWSHLVAKHKISPKIDGDAGVNIIGYQTIDDPLPESTLSPPPANAKIVVVKSNEEVKTNEFFMLNPNLYKLITLGPTNNNTCMNNDKENK